MSVREFISIFDSLVHSCLLSCMQVELLQRIQVRRVLSTVRKFFSGGNSVICPCSRKRQTLYCLFLQFDAGLSQAVSPVC